MTDTAEECPIHSNPETQPDPEPGDLVLVWAQVVEGNTHPDDVLVKFVSHSEHYSGHIRRDRVAVLPDRIYPSALVEQCSHLGSLHVHNAHLNSVVMVRCERHEGHGKKHRAEDVEWDDDGTVGYFEVR